MLLKIFANLIVFLSITHTCLAGVLQGKVAIVTGGAQGIGEAIAEKFASEGASVVIADINTNLGEMVAKRISETGRSCIFVQCDVSDENDIKALVEKTNDSFGSPDIIVNNAAIAIYKKMEEFSPLEWDKVINVNLRSIYLLARECIPMMIKRGEGNIISIASVHTRTTSTSNNPYVATKGAISALTRAMALEGAPHNIRVNCISPGAIATPMLLENWGDVDPSAHPLLSRIPLKRFGNPTEIASVALFLASDGASYITGSELLVDGGLSAHFD
ncbi:MAG: hypothetical protein CK425_04335 [Parachlamydia sp.]|nr:MAG: hypothetical protein CK425_04335 [Parachlamydia sp.]